jgi:propanediol dehydratase large subunit
LFHGDVTGKAKAIETYKNHQLTLTSLVCFFGTLLAFATTLVMEHKDSVWTIGWDMNLLASAYAVRTLHIKKKILFLIKLFLLLL